MSKKHKAVFGIYKTRAEAEAAVTSLQIDGFSTADVSVLLPQSGNAQDLAHVKGSKAPEGAAAGASTGAVIGGTLGLLAGIGALAIPGVGPLIAAGPIMAAMAGLGVGGAVGGIAGSLIGLGMPEYEAKRYEGYVKNGGILLSVHTHTSEQTEKAIECLKRTGAQDVASTNEVEADEVGPDWDTPVNARRRLDEANPPTLL